MQRQPVLACYSIWPYKSGSSGVISRHPKARGGLTKERFLKWCQVGKDQGLLEYEAKAFMASMETLSPHTLSRFQTIRRGCALEHFVSLWVWPAHFLHQSVPEVCETRYPRHFMTDTRSEDRRQQQRDEVDRRNMSVDMQVDLEMPHPAML
jgi:hypothetical protein